MEGRCDLQSHANAQYLLGHRGLHEALEKAGHLREAVVLRVIGDAWAAFKMPGLTSQVRLESLHRVKYLVVRMLGSTLHDPAAMKHVRTGGLVTKQLLDLMYNAEQVFHLVSDMSPEARERFLLQSLTTIMNESEFSHMYSVTGGKKPNVEQLKRTTMYRDVVLMLKADTSRNWRAMTSKRLRKDPTDRSLLSHWNDGTGDYHKYLHVGTDSVMKRAQRMQRGNRPTPVRKFYKDELG